VSQSRNETVGHFRKDFFTAAFLKYPDAIRRSLSTTNTAQAVTGQLERIRRNSGGYFQSDDALEMKLGMTITSLENGR